MRKLEVQGCSGVHCGTCTQADQPVAHLMSPAPARVSATDVAAVDALVGGPSGFTLLKKSAMQFTTRALDLVVGMALARPEL